LRTLWRSVSNKGTKTRQTKERYGGTKRKGNAFGGVSRKEGDEPEVKLMIFHSWPARRGGWVVNGRGRWKREDIASSLAYKFSIIGRGFFA